MKEQEQPQNDGPSQRERMLAGELYIADDPELARESLRAAQLTQAFNTSDPARPEERRTVLKELLGFLGEGAEWLGQGQLSPKTCLPMWLPLGTRRG